MEVDLRALENKLTNLLAQLDGRENELLVKLRAIEVPPEANTASPPESAPETSRAEDKPPSLKAQILNAAVEDAILAVLRSWDTRLKSAKIAEELIAAGYPFPSGNPRDFVTNELQEMASANKIKKVKTVKGTYFTLP